MTKDRSWCRNRQRLPCPASGDESCGVDLELAETRTFSSSIVYLRYRVAR